ncbi:hypothetical protein [Sphingomonas sp. TREG-RG-20F-R18-01]|uniref:hypothetical protein n=1 Tax=Sphingomonas sp. TREG-RG-20F-R18-01 TaxID=2914982 RepID=UPI001F5909E7|nr:hypothetical protein [Sphingomonas sp. TREG-RG-20F-R18-01]
MLLLFCDVGSGFCRSLLRSLRRAISLLGGLVGIRLHCRSSSIRGVGGGLGRVFRSFVRCCLCCEVTRRLGCIGSIRALYDASDRTSLTEKLAAGPAAAPVGAPTGGWVNQTSIACSWKGSGALTHSGSVNQVKGDHTLTFDMPSWGGAVKNTWFSLYGVNAADPFREFECHDAKNASGNEFSKEVIASSSKYAVLRFMDWNETNSSPARTAANRPDPRTLDNPGQALENQMRLAKLADADPWFNHSWNDDATYMQWAAKQAHDTLPAGHKIYVELSNEVWNFQFWQAQDNLAQATTLKINPNNGYGAWQNYSRRAIDMFKIWEAAFADRPKDLVRVLGTQSAYPEVTRQEMSYPGIADHVDAIAGAPYFSHDRQGPYSDALLQASVTDAVATLKTTCDIARASAPNIRCITYEGGQHELPTALLPQNQFETLERSQFMGDMYAQYLKAISA